MDEITLKAALAYARAVQARGEREAEYVTVDLGGGIGWRLRRRDWERVIYRRRRA